jgi:hypothetical protein
MSNPTQRWRSAYGALSISEQALLTALLDFDEAAYLNQLKQAYEQRIRHEQTSCLPCATAISRLEHSFIRVSRSYLGAEIVDFRHPSLRDMLLEQLRDNSNARKRYIELTTPAGLAALMRGLAHTKD